MYIHGKYYGKKNQRVINKCTIKNGRKMVAANNKPLGFFGTLLKFFIG